MNHYIEHSNVTFSDKVFISYKNHEITFSEFYDNVSSNNYFDLINSFITSLNVINLNNLKI